MQACGRTFVTAMTKSYRDQYSCMANLGSYLADTHVEFCTCLQQTPFCKDSRLSSHLREMSSEMDWPPGLGFCNLLPVDELKSVQY